MEPLTWILLGASLVGLVPFAAEAVAPLQMISVFVPGLFFGLALASVFPVSLGRFWLLGLLGSLEQYGAVALGGLTGSMVAANGVAALVFALTAKGIVHRQLSWTRVGLCLIAGSLSGLPMFVNIFPPGNNNQPAVFLGCILWQASVFSLIWRDGRGFRKSTPVATPG